MGCRGVIRHNVPLSRVTVGCAVDTAVDTGLLGRLSYFTVRNKDYIPAMPEVQSGAER